jgi:hypothetical protein
MRNAMVEACIESVSFLVESSLDVSEGAHAVGGSCDLHAITGNVLHCCKELVGSGPVYRSLFELAVRFYNYGVIMCLSGLLSTMTSLNYSYIVKLLTSCHYCQNTIGLTVPSDSENVPDLINVLLDNLYSSLEVLNI